MTPWTNLGPLPGSRVHLSLFIQMIGQIAASQPQPTSQPQFTQDHLRKDSAPIFPTLDFFGQHSLLMANFGV